jgi:hypothetical protein
MSVPLVTTPSSTRRVITISPWCSPEADELLDSDPLALLLGVMLDRQVR